MISKNYDAWRRSKGAELEAKGEVEPCIRCAGTGEGHGTPCPSCAGVGYFEFDPEDLQLFPAPQLSKRKYAVEVLASVQRWCDWTGDDLVSEMNALCGEGGCPIDPADLLSFAYRDCAQ